MGQRRNYMLLTLFPLIFCVYILSNVAPARAPIRCRMNFTKYGSECVANADVNWYSNQINQHEMTPERKFVFFQGLDSAGGNYFAVKGGKGDVKLLERICRRTPRCLAFNTDGMLKHTLQRPSKWAHWTEKGSEGLYVIDTDYCKLNKEKCPAPFICHRFSPGNYSCKCNSSWLFECGTETSMDSISASERTELGRSTGDINVVLAIDAKGFVGTVALISSIVNNTRSRDRLKVHVVLAGTTEESFRQYLRCFTTLSQQRLDVVELDTTLMTKKIRVESSVVRRHGNLKSVANFARFKFHEIFPDMKKALYIDADVIVKGDIAELWQQLEDTDKLLLLAARRNPKYADMFSYHDKVAKYFKERYGKTLDMNRGAFNNGVYGMNLELWRQRNVGKEVEYWIDVRYESKETLWHLGTQPILLLVGYDDWTPMDPAWNVDGVGYKYLSKKKLDSAKLLHWTGLGKPWKKNGLHKGRWTMYAPEACSGHGTCVATKPAGSFGCKCKDQHTGERCQTFHL